MGETREEAVVSAWLLVAVVFAALWAFWGLLGLTFDAIERWQQGRRR